MKDICNKCKKLNVKQKVYKPFFDNQRFFYMELEETGPSKIITHIVDLVNFFPNIDNDSL